MTVIAIVAVIAVLALGVYLVARLLFPVRINWAEPPDEPTEYGGYIAALEAESRRNVERIARMGE